MPGLLNLALRATETLLRLPHLGLNFRRARIALIQPPAKLLQHFFLRIQRRLQFGVHLIEPVIEAVGIVIAPSETGH